MAALSSRPKGKGGFSMRNMLSLSRIMTAVLLLAVCFLPVRGFAEEEWPAYTGKLTQEDAFGEDTVSEFFDRLPLLNFYAYDAARPEWKQLTNGYQFYQYNIRLSSGEPVKDGSIEQLSGPAALGAFYFNPQTAQVEMAMDRISRAVPGVYRFLLTAEGETRYARAPFSVEIREQPKDLEALRVRPVMIVRPMERVQNPERSAILGAPREAHQNVFKIHDPVMRIYNSIHPEASKAPKGSNYLLVQENGGAFVFEAREEGVYPAELESWLGQVLHQVIRFDVIVSSTLTYDDFAFTLSPEAARAAGGQKVKMSAVFANPDAVNAKAKNNGIVWRIATPEGEDASAWASVSSGTVTIGKVDAARDLVVTAQSALVPDKSASAVIHVVPLTAKLSAEAETDALYLLDGMNETRIAVSAEPADAEPSVSFSSSSEKVAAVDENGLVTAVSAGSVTITAAAKDGSKKSAAVKLKVLSPVTKITLSAAQDRVAPGKTLKIKAVLEPDKPSDKTLTWTIESADAGLADAVKVSKDGAVSVAKGCPAGSFTVRATANGSAPSSPVFADMVLLVSE